LRWGGFGDDGGRCGWSGGGGKEGGREVVAGLLLVGLPGSIGGVGGGDGGVEMVVWSHCGSGGPSFVPQFLWPLCQLLPHDSPCCSQSLSHWLTAHSYPLSVVVNPVITL
jgi:hypothetical protein